MNTRAIFGAGLLGVGLACAGELCAAAAPEGWVGKVIVPKSYSGKMFNGTSWEQFESVLYRRYKVEHVEGNGVFIVSDDLAKIRGRARAKDVLTLEGAIVYHTREIPRDGKYALTRRGDIWQALGDYEKALADYEAALQISPTYAGAQDSRAELLLRIGKDYDQAIAHFDFAIPQYQEFRDIGARQCESGDYYGRAFAWQCKGEYARAIADYRSAIRVYRHATGPHRDLAWLLATCPEEKFRDAKLALKEAQIAHKLTNGKEAFALETLAVAYAENGDFKNAIKWETTLIDMDENPDHRKLYERRLALYKDHKPYRETEEARAAEPPRHDFDR